MLSQHFSFPIFLFIIIHLSCIAWRRSALSVVRTITNNKLMSSFLNIDCTAIFIIRFRIKRECVCACEKERKRGEGGECSFIAHEYEGGCTISMFDVARAATTGPSSRTLFASAYVTDSRERKRWIASRDHTWPKGKCLWCARTH